MKNETVFVDKNGTLIDDMAQGCYTINKSEAIFIAMDPDGSESQVWLVKHYVTADVTAGSVLPVAR